MEQTVSKILNEVKDAICNDYCRYPREYDAEEHDDVELFDSDICRNCPLNRL